MLPITDFNLPISDYKKVKIRLKATFDTFEAKCI